jgi:pterin-4a-carbinolamine dehydratase
MITHRRLVEDAAERTRLPSARAARAIKVTLAVLALHLDMPTRQRLRAAVPGPDRDAVRATVPPSGGTVTDFYAEVAAHLPATPEQGRHVARTVLSLIARDDPGLARHLAEGLPPGFAEAFTAPDAHPERLPGEDAPLTEAELRAALGRRPQWSGDAHRLTRTVGLPRDRVPPLLHQVESDARELHRRVGHVLSDDGITFTVRTRSVDAVTATDLELADRIDAAVTAVGSGGRPG